LAVEGGTISSAVVSTISSATASRSTSIAVDTRTIVSLVIFKEGLTVRGLNTAATLWCSAAVGLLAGAGFALYAGIATGFVIFVNLLLRPLVSLINRRPLSTTELSIGYRVSVTCSSAQEAHIRALMLQALGQSTAALHKLESSDLVDSGRVQVSASLTSPHRHDKTLEQIVGRLSLEPAVTAASWQAEPVLDG
jgi:putative Mg2+ transporter-C (MgtC) family protein